MEEARGDGIGSNGRAGHGGSVGERGVVLLVLAGYEDIRLAMREITDKEF